MSVLDTLSGIAGGIQGGMDAYDTIQQQKDRALLRQQTLAEMRQRQQQFQEEEEDRRDRLAQQQKTETDAAASRLQTQKDKESAAQDAFYKQHQPWLSQTAHGRQMLSSYYQSKGLNLEPDDFDPSNALIPSSLQGAPPEVIAAWKANLTTGGKLTVTPDMMLTPQQRADAAAAKKKAEDDAAFALFQREKNYEQGLTARKPIPDDPSLPAGARVYIAGLPAKYNGDYAQANTEFQQALPQMQAQHPHLDVQKARQAFNASFPPNAVPARPMSMPATRGGGTSQSNTGGGQPTSTSATSPQPAAPNSGGILSRIRQRIFGGSTGSTPSGSGAPVTTASTAPNAAAPAGASQMAAPSRANALLPAPSAAAPPQPPPTGPYAPLQLQIRSTTDPAQKAILQDKLKRSIADDLKAAGHKVSWNKDGSMSVDGLPYHVPDALSTPAAVGGATAASSPVGTRQPIPAPPTTRRTASPQAVALAAKGTEVLGQLQSEHDPQRKAALQQQLQTIREQLAAAIAQSGGGF